MRQKPARERLFGAAFIFVLIAGFCLHGQVQAQEAMQSGEAFVTRFSGTTDEAGRLTIDLDGAVGIIIDLRPPGGPPQGEHWWNEPQRLTVTAGEVGQVFGIAIDDSTEPSIYLSATSVFGLHRAADNVGWMPGLWGPEAGPGTIYRLTPVNEYQPEVFARITLDGRSNSAAALGNIAYDRWHNQLYVSDLETGMIHRLRNADGFDLGRFDHGMQGRSDFRDVPRGARQSLPTIGFDASSTARLTDCPTGDFSRTPSCWNFADFRRRVWGLGVRRDPITRDVRLYYSVWSSQGFGHPEHAGAGDEARNSVWSVRIDESGAFDAGDVRREFILPEFFRDPTAIARAGVSHPVADIAFPAFGNQDVMLLAERGGVRNQGLGAENAFATPHEARVLRYERDADGIWQPSGRYDIGQYDRRDEGPPYLRANAAGGVAFGLGYGESWEANPQRTDGFVWATGDALCSPRALCFDSSASEHNDSSHVHGIQGRVVDPSEAVEPDAAFEPYPDPGPATPADGPNRAFMIDADINVDANDNGIEAELTRNDATRIGDVEIYQAPPNAAERPLAGPWYGPWEESWPWPVPEDEYPAVDPGGPELALTKTAPAACPNGGPCTFTIDIVNNGPGTYSGPLHMVDTPDGAFLIAESTGWFCQQPVPGGMIGCRHDPVILVPGDGVTLALTVVNPAIWVPPWGPDFAVRSNCGFVVWPDLLEGPARIRAIEAALLLQGYPPGAVDGVADAAIQAAIDAYRLDNGLPPGGIDNALFNALFPDSAGLEGDGLPDNDWDCADYQIPLTPPAVLPETLGNVELGLEMSGLPGACVPGDICNFRITVTNNGTDAYTGPIAIGDVAGIIGMEAIPGGGIQSLIPAVTCEAITPGVACRYPGPVTIDPGGAVNFDLRVIVPGTAAGQTLRSIAFILWEEMPFPGGDGTPLNDVDDMEIDFGDEPPVPPPAGAGVDLAITKVVAPDQTCQPGGRCLFLVDIENTGDEPIAERLIVREVATIDGSVQVPATAIAHGDGVLLCTRIGETPFDRHCVVNYAGGEGLAPGATITTEIYVNITESVVADAVLQNCVQIAWDAMDFPGGRDDNPANDGEVCVTVDVVAEDPPITEPADESAQIDLRIEKSAPETCTRGEVCRFSTSIFNDGPGQYVGPLQITDRLFQWEDRPVPSEAPRVIPPQWTCAPDSANRGAVCTLGANDALTLDRFHSMPLAFEWTVPMDEPLGWLRNCARVRWPGAPSEDSMVFAELMLAHAGFDPGDVDGTITDETLNAVREFRIREGLSADGGFDAALFEALYQGTGALSADSFTDNNRHCADTTIVERGADLEPEGDTSCQRGEDCDLSVRIRNSGDLPFVGDAGMTGRLTPEVPIAEVQGITPGLTCSVQGVGEYVCRGSALSLKPGEAAEIRLVISVPANFAADQITHAKTMVWPDVAVKDDYPDNDRDESIITIEGALPPQQLAAPDLAITKTAGQGTCQAGQSCRFNIQVRNVGTRPYVGPIRIVDNLNVSGVRLVSSAPSDWRCRLSRGRVSCTTARTTLEPGQTRSLSLTLRTARSARGSAENCAALDWTPQTTAMSVQQALNELGFNAGSVDGKPGRNTRWAIRNYEAVVGIPDIGEIDDTLLGRLFESWGVGDGVANNDRACATINLSAPPQPEPQIEPVRPDPVVPPPVAGPECARGEIQVSRRRARTLSAQGWRVRTVQRGGLSILCARQVAPPPPPPCTGGRVRNPQGECVCPANRPVWNGRACIRRAPPPSCPRGWRQLTRQQAKALVPQGWEVRQFGNLLCGRQRAVSPTCPRGWKQVNRQQAKALVAQGWRIRQVGNLLCARQR